MKKQKTIYLLIGLKGSGKSYIGQIFDEYFDVKFIRVEDSVKKLRRDREIDDESYIKEAFELIEKVIRESLETSSEVIFESTGLSKYFENMIESLKLDFNVVTIRVVASLEVCLERIKSRDQSIHVNVSDEELNKINERATKKIIKTDFTLLNIDKTIDDLKFKIAEIITRSAFILD